MSVGRDGETPIYGLLVHPAGATKKYWLRCLYSWVGMHDLSPVLENIYAGPHDAHCPKAFGLYNHFQGFASKGFVVAMCDGQGTNRRGRKFLEHCWRGKQCEKCKMFSVVVVRLELGLFS